MSSNLGLSNARNKGLAEAKGEYIAYLDDDVLVQPQWVEKVIFVIEKYPHLDGCGGPLYPFYTTPKPDWYEEAYDVQMSRKEIYFLAPGHGFIGANMVWDRKFLESIGGFQAGVRSGG